MAASTARSSYRQFAPSWSGGSTGAAATEQLTQGDNSKAPGLSPGLFSRPPPIWGARKILFFVVVLWSHADERQRGIRVTAERPAVAIEVSDSLTRFAYPVPLL